VPTAQTIRRQPESESAKARYATAEHTADPPTLSGRHTRAHNKPNRTGTAAMRDF
jgi:hypothetical protein